MASRSTPRRKERRARIATARWKPKRTFPRTPPKPASATRRTSTKIWLSARRRHRALSQIFVLVLLVALAGFGGVLGNVLFGFHLAVAIRARLSFLLGVLLLAIRSRRAHHEACHQDSRGKRHL